MNKVESALMLARKCLAHHGLGDTWTAQTDSAKARAGACHYDRRCITLSEHFVGSATFRDIHNVVLHEIAHAMAGPAAGHGPAWRKVALDIGCDGARCAPSGWEAPRPALVASCACGAVRLARHRRTAKFREALGKKCSTCGTLVAINTDHNFTIS